MPAERRTAVGGVEIAAYEWGQPHADQPSILFAHARRAFTVTSGAGDRAAACFSLHRVGFSRTRAQRQARPALRVALPPTTCSAWRGRSGLHHAVGVGHSLGGHAVTLAAAREPELFAALLLIDPVIMPREYYVGVVEFEHFTARRRNEWASPDEMHARFSERPPFSSFKPEVLRDYVDYGLVQHPRHRLRAGVRASPAKPPPITSARQRTSTRRLRP
ncbi:MAG: alpha/beta hydrolase [Anaerolineae bacterium]